MFVKADRIMERIKQTADILTKSRKLPYSDISYREFEDFIKTIDIIVNTELNDKGVQRQWKA